MSQTKIRKALIKALNDATLGITLVFPNTATKTASGEPSGEVAIVWNNPTVHTLGDHGEDMHTGFVQVLLCFPLGLGDLPMLEVSDRIRNAFKAGGRKWYQDQEVVIENCGIGRPEQLDGKYVSPVSIYWYAKTRR